MTAKLRRKLLVYAALTVTCLYQTVGCPQLLGNAFKDGSRSFFETGLTAALLTALDVDEAISDLLLST